MLPSRAKQKKKKNQGSARHAHDHHKPRRHPSLSPSSLGRRHGVDPNDAAEQVLDDLVLMFLPGLLDLADLALGLLVRLVLGLLVALRVLCVCVVRARRTASEKCTTLPLPPPPPLLSITYLGLELLELGLLLGLVLLDLLLGLVASLLDALGPVWRRAGGARIGLPARQPGVCSV